MSGAEIGGAVALGIGGYLLGAVPVGLWLGLARGVDLRRHGSGNIGTTNAFRVLGARLGTVVLLCDIAKGAVPALLAGLLFPPWVAVVLAALPVIGHLRSVFIGWRGGKGVATGAGVVLGLMWLVFFIVLGAFLLVLLTTRMVSAASLAAAVTFPIAAWLTGQPLAYLIVAFVLSPLVIAAHHDNIVRLVRGTERRVTFPWNRRTMDERGDDPAGASADTRRQP